MSTYKRLHPLNGGDRRLKGDGLIPDPTHWDVVVFCKGAESATKKFPLIRPCTLTKAEIKQTRKNAYEHDISIQNTVGGVTSELARVLASTYG